MFLNKLKKIFSGDNDEIIEAIQAGGALIDVRSRGEFTAGSVQGAINIPYNEISSKKKLIKKIRQPIIVFCASGSRSLVAVQTLKDLGYDAVINGKTIFKINRLVSKSVG